MFNRLRTNHLIITLIFLFFNLSSIECFDGGFEDQKVLNQKVANIALQAYEQINKNWQMPLEGSSLTGYHVNKKYWNCETEFLDTTVQVRWNGIGKPSEAIENLINYECTLDCRIALYTVMTYTFLKIVGDDIFNSIYKNGLVSGKKFSITSSRNPIFEHAVQESRQYIWELKIPGLFGYIHNVSFYGKLHPNGTARGENVMISSVDEKTGSPLFIGYQFEKPLAQGEMIEHLKRAFLQPSSFLREMKNAIDPQKLGNYMFEDLLSSALENRKSVEENFEHLVTSRNNSKIKNDSNVKSDTKGDTLVYEFSLEKINKLLIK